MWDYEYSLETTASPEAVWALYADTTSWPKWDSGLESMQLDGPLAAGTTGTLVPKGQGTLPFTVSEATPHRSFTDETQLGELTLRFIHTLEPSGNITKVTHRVEIDGPAADHVGPEMGPKVTADIPDSVAKLVTLAAA
ncbi:SRPBCC family protein [Streptomyces flavofungini]|uniref:SRPBCC family protein n=1 Tax=Streptomyces flavofungini TaxID=68200 RepID=A0ABS0XGN8_9ACTN|nr:SRPBCC family protein [Streptomyces flavofungini]MBJ3812388.1 SRPBCC family protein [Streptomyces flavofungini]GHC88045.1 hypothetical protein GCM10010349_75020 [Streptomyces flavofungini]